MPSKITIYANSGRFNDLYDAAFAEDRIDWSDDSHVDCHACTESFGAYKLSGYLKEAGLLNVELSDDAKVAADSQFTIALVTRKSGDEFFEACGVDASSMYPTEPVSADAYAIRTIQLANKTVIAFTANSRIGVLYAMYHFLRYNGFAFISVDAQGFVIPTLNTLRIPNDTIDEVPDYDLRGALSGYSNDSNQRFFEWYVANRLNYLSIKVLHNPNLIKKFGIRLCGGGHAAFYHFLPADQPFANSKDGGTQQTYFEAHPEWFALRDGKRSAGVKKDSQKQGYFTGNNFCTSNKDAVDMFCQNYLHALIDGSMQHVDIIDVWPLDNGLWCECDACEQTGNYARRILMVAYAMQKAIEVASKSGRLKRRLKIFVPAYHETLSEPDMPLPDDFDYDMIKVTLFTIERCYVHDLFDPHCTETNRYLADHIHEWTTKEDRNYKGELVIGEYFNVSSFASIPIVLTQRIAKDLVEYHRVGARHFNFMHIITQNWGAKIVNNNLYAALLWDVHLDADSFTEKLLKDFYQDAYDDIKNVYEDLETALQNAKYIFHYQFVDGSINALKRNIQSEKPFVAKHIQYDTVLQDQNAGIDFQTGLAMMKRLSEQMNTLSLSTRDLRIKERITQLFIHVRYGYELYLFYDRLLAYFQAKWQKDDALCTKIASELIELNDTCVSYKWALAGYKSDRMFFDSLSAASWQKKIFDAILQKTDPSRAKADPTL